MAISFAIHGCLWAPLLAAQLIMAQSQMETILLYTEWQILTASSPGNTPGKSSLWQQEVILSDGTSAVRDNNEVTVTAQLAREQHCD